MAKIHLYSMSTGVYETAGKCLPVSYGMVDTPQGRAFIAESCGRILYFALHENEKEQLKDFQRRWHLSKPTHRPEHCQRLADNIFSDTDSSPARLLVLGSDFQIKVWEAVARTAAGEVTTYEKIAEEIDQPDALSDVVNAIGDNPIAYFIPCHRIILTDGSLGSYRWGQESKRELLQAEGLDLDQLSVA